MIFPKKTKFSPRVRSLTPLTVAPLLGRCTAPGVVCLGFFLVIVCSVSKSGRFRALFVQFSGGFRCSLVVQCRFLSVRSRFVSRSSLGVRYKNQCKNVIFSGFARASFAAAWGCGVSPGMNSTQYFLPSMLPMLPQQMQYYSGFAVFWAVTR